MKIGYVGVSTDDKNPDMQVAALERAGAEKIYKDHGVSGTTAKRPALLRCLKALDDSDTLIVWKLDRLGRSLHDVVIMLDDLHHRGIKFHSLTESFDTKPPMGRAMMQMAGVLAELARSLITERTREGVKAAQRRGVRFGPKFKLTAQQVAHARQLLDKGEDRQSVAALFKVHHKTLYRALRH